MDIFIATVILLVAFTILLPLYIAQHWVDKNTALRSRPKVQPNTQQPHNRAQRTQLRTSANTQQKNEFHALFAAIIAMQTKIAKCDGVISASEASYIMQNITQLCAQGRQYGLHPVHLKAYLMQTYTNAQQRYTSISTDAKRLQNQTIHTKEQILKQLITLALIDAYTPLKESLIFTAAASMGLYAEQVRRHIDALRGVSYPKRQDATPYRILGCSATDSDASIKHTYRALVKAYHPDLLYTKGLSPQEMKEAQEKMQSINSAYVQIKKQRGF